MGLVAPSTSIFLAILLAMTMIIIATMLDPPTACIQTALAEAAACYCGDASNRLLRQLTWGFFAPPTAIPSWQVDMLSIWALIR